MEILVNESPIEFSLEKEITLEAVIENIEQWALKENMYILDYKVETKGDSHHSNIMSDEIDKLSVSIGNYEDLLSEIIAELAVYVDRVGTHLASKYVSGGALGEKEIEDLNEGFKWIGSTLNRLTNLSGAAALLEALPEDLGLLNSNGEKYPQVLQFLGQLRNNVILWQKKLAIHTMGPEEMKKFIAMFITESLEKINLIDMISGNITAGKDSSAFPELQNLVEWLMNGIAVIEKYSPENPLVTNSITVLTEIDTAITEEDFVTLADIVDFDLRDLVDAISTYVLD